MNPSRSILVAALVAIACLGTAAVLFVTGDDQMQRLGLLLGFLGTIITVIAGALRADAAATSTSRVSNIAQALNGGFEARVRHANRETAAETGSRADVKRAEADAVTAAALSHENGDPPDPPVRPT